MVSSPDSQDQKPASSTTELHRGGWMSWIGSLVLALALLIIYSANSRDHGHL